MDIINVAIVVIVNPVTRNLSWVNPHVFGQVLMRIANTGIEYGDYDFRRVVSDFPGFSSANIRPFDASQLTGILDSPLLAVRQQGVVW